MNTSLPSCPFQVLIVAKTRLKNGFCVGGIAQNGRSVRLGLPAQFIREQINHEYEIGDVWSIEHFIIAKNLTPPHTEDIVVHSKKWIRKSDQLLAAIERLMPPVVGGIDALFDGAVQCAKNGRLYIGHQQVPDYSTLFWRPDRPLHPTGALTGKFRYRYGAEDGDCFLSFVGSAKAVLPAGTLLRVSLARWWKVESIPDMEEACYLQVSGWFEENGLADDPDVLKTHDVDGDIGNVLYSTDDVSLSEAPVNLSTPPKEPVQANLPDLLQTQFGFHEFRPYQREIIESVLLRHDTLVVMSTGAGKSLCYQLPALVFRGLTVVISPLISLMQDQVTHLHHYGIAAATLNSHTDANERAQIIRQIGSGELKLLYLSPERLALPGTIELLQSSNVEFLVVDEAHCISQWGHDFRTEYREILYMRKVLGNLPILALTATATSEVRKDIVDNLKLLNVKEFVAPFNRPNLFLAVQPRRDDTWQVLDFLEAHAGQSGIIYCSTQKGVDTLTETLQQAGIHALPYHAGLASETRIRNHYRFSHEEVVVMVATVAFGMGIDKPDIRFVLHYNLASDPESYYQQIGRAGRDGDRADCLLLHAPEDFGTIKFLIERGDPTQAPYAMARLQHMAAWIEDLTCRRKWLLEYFGERGASTNCGMCDACVVVESAKTEGSDDITAQAFLFLSCVKQVRQRFGTTHLVAILCGSRAQKLLRWKHDQLPIFGKGNALTRSVWKELATQFFKLGLVTMDQMGVVKLTQRGQAVLAGEKVFGSLKTKRSAASSKLGGGEVGDVALFEKLRAVRRQLADTQGVPSFVIFSDRSLRDMATQMPQSDVEFSRIHGVGAHKRAQFGEVFLKVIREHCNSSDGDIAPVLHIDRPRSSTSTAQQRLDIAITGLQAGKSLDEVADECGVQPITVMRYVYRYSRKQGTLPAGVAFPLAQVPNEIRDQVFRLFAERGLNELGPVYWAMDEQVEYIDLDLMRIEYLQRIEIEMGQTH